MDGKKELGREMGSNMDGKEVRDRNGGLKESPRSSWEPVR